MKSRELSDDLLDAIDSQPSEVAELLMRFNVGEYWERSFRIKEDPRDTRSMIQYIDLLKDSGLDVGNGEAEFGFRMPLPEREATQRSLVIFRKRIGSVLEVNPEKPNKGRNRNTGRNFRKIK